MQDIFSAVRIVDVYTCLTGCTPKQSGKCFRGKATWRNGDGLNVSLDNDRGVWHDFATDDGGGILDLVVRIQGGTRKDALIWLAEFTGIPLESKEFTPEERTEWVEARKALERDLPEARYWQRAAVNMAEDALVYFKACLFDPIPEPEDLSESLQLPSDNIFDIEQMLVRLKPLDGQRLVEDYQWWREHYPFSTAALVEAAKRQEQMELVVLKRYLRSSNERSRG